MVLTREENEKCQEVFRTFDKDDSGKIDVWELRQVFEALGQTPTEADLATLIQEVDGNMSGSICFEEFKNGYEIQKQRSERLNDENEYVDAFVACGGNPDKSGCVKRDTLVKIIKTEFGLAIDVEEMIDKIDVDGSGRIDFDKFKLLLN